MAVYAELLAEARNRWGRKVFFADEAQISGRMRTCGGNGYSKESQRW